MFCWFKPQTKSFYLLSVIIQFSVTEEKKYLLWFVVEIEIKIERESKMTYFEDLIFVNFHQSFPFGFWNDWNTIRQKEATTHWSVQL